MLRHASTMVVLVATSVTPAAAQSKTAQAEAMFRRGQELLAKGDTAAACDAFDSSQRLEPAVTTQLNQANCREKNGQLATAWGLFVDAARGSRGATDAELKTLNKVASDRAQKLEPRLSTLAVTVPDVNRVVGLEVLVDDHALDTAMWNQAVPIDGGTHTVTARAPGNAEWKATVTVGIERDAKTVDVPRLKEAAVVADETEPDPEREHDDATPSGSRRAPLLVGTAAVVLGGAAVGLALWGDSTYDKALAEPDRDRQLDLWHSAENKRYAAQAVGVVALGCVGTAVWLYVRSRHDGDRREVATRRIDVVPNVSAGSASFSVLGHF